LVTAPRFILANLYNDVGELKEALKWCDNYITAFSTSEIGYQFKALIEASKGFVPDAFKSLETTYELNRRNSASREQQIVE